MARRIVNVPQFKTVIWLRWRLSRNQLMRGGPIGKGLAIILLVLGGIAVIASAAAGLLIGMMAMEHASPSMQALTWNGLFCFFLLFWVMGLLIELQRAESINLERFLHLPVSLRQIFFFNYLTSHLSPVFLIFVPGMLTLSLGLAIKIGPLWLLMVPLVISFLFCLSAWTYCLRGWLASLMTNKRRQRTIAVGMTMGIILIAQLPNLYINVLQPHKKRSQETNANTSTNQVSSSAPTNDRRDGGQTIADTLTRVQPWVPLLWVGHGAMQLSERNTGPAFAHMTLFLLAGLLGVRTAYRATLRHYTKGGQQSKKVAQKKIGQPANWVDYEMPFLPHTVGTMSITFFRSILRAPEMKMALLTPLIIMVIFGSVILRNSSDTHQAILHSMLPTTVSFLILFGLIQISANHFGFDRHGFRALVLLPVRRADILLAKNLALFPLALGLELIGLTAVTLLTKTGWSLALAGFFQFLAGYIILSLIGNLGSILAAFRMPSGAMKRNKPPARSILANLGIHLLLPVMMTPVAIPVILQILCDMNKWLPGVPVALIGSTLVLAIFILVYHYTLPGLGRLLQRREMTILETVTREID